MCKRCIELRKENERLLNLYGKAIKELVRKTEDSEKLRNTKGKTE